MPTSTPTQRTLATIVFTDVVGFSARMQEDESRTIALSHRDLRMVSHQCQKMGGKILKNTGDGLLMCFSTVGDALRCALKIQSTFAHAAAKLPARDVLHHRVGIHLGDVFLTETDVFGDGVNIAARLMAEAQPGGVCFSQTVYDLVKTRLNIKPTFLGPRDLKNIRDPVPAYQVLGSQILQQEKQEKLNAAGDVEALALRPSDVAAAESSAGPARPSGSLKAMLCGRGVGGKLFWGCLLLVVGGSLAAYAVHRSRQRDDPSAGVVGDAAAHVPAFASDSKVGLLRSFHARKDIVFGVSLSPDGRRALCRSHDAANTTQSTLYDVENNREIGSWLGSSASMSSDWKRLLIESEGMWRVFSTQGMEELLKIRSAGGGGWGSLCEDGSTGMICRGGKDSSISFYEMTTGTQIKVLHDTPPNTDGNEVHYAISPDGQQIASGPTWGDHLLRTWDVKTGRQIGTTDVNGCDGLRYSKDGRFLIVQFHAGSGAALVDAKTVETVAVCDHRQMSQIAFAPRAVGAGGAE